MNRTSSSKKIKKPGYKHIMLFLANSFGFSYIEVICAVVLVAVSLVPIMETLSLAVNGAGVYESSIVDQLALQSKIEEVLKEPPAELEAAAVVAGSPTIPTIYSDPDPTTTTDGRQITRQVYLGFYDINNSDGDNDPFTVTGTDVLLYVKVEIDGSPFFLETLTNM